MLYTFVHHVHPASFMEFSKPRIFVPQCYVTKCPLKSPYITLCSYPARAIFVLFTNLKYHAKDNTVPVVR